MMSQETEGTAEGLQVLETTTTEAAAEQTEFAIAPVVLPPEPTEEVAVEVPRLEEKRSHPKVAEDQDQEVVAHKDEQNGLSNEPHGNLGEEVGDVDGELEGDILSASAQRDKLSQDRKQSRKEAINRRYSFGLPNETRSEMDDKDKGQEEEDSDEDKEEHKVEYKEEDKEEHKVEVKKEQKEEHKVEYKEEEKVLSILDEEGESDVEEPKLKTRFEESHTGGIFGALGEDTAKGSKEIFYMDPKYDNDNSEVASVASLKSSKSTRSIKADTIQMKEEFLLYFQMPSLSDISEEHEPDDLSLDNVSLVSMAQVKGHFTDPLSADFHETSSTSSEGALLSDHEDQDDAEAAASPLESSSEIWDLPDDVLASPDEAPKTKELTVTVEEVPVSFHEIQVIDLDEDDERPKKEIGVDTMVHDFLEHLLENIITAYEKHESDNRLRTMCDRGKLLAELKNITDTYVTERYTNEMLNIRLVEYYKRVHNLRAFAHVDDEENYVARYYEALAKVDGHNLRLDAIKYKFEAEIAKMRLQLHAVQHFVYFTESRLEFKARKYLVRPDSEFSKRFVDWALRQMYAKRNEISDMRLRLILKKTTLAELQAKLTELEALSSTVSIQDFLAIQNDVINLGKKIEERNIELNKMRTQYLMDVHITHHNREKAHALEDKLTHMKITLANAIKKQRSLRASLYSKKLERTRIREKRLALTFQGGILAMPALMYEYDKTVEHVRESRKRVTKLRDTVEALNSRFSRISENRSS